MSTHQKQSGQVISPQNPQAVTHSLCDFTGESSERICQKDETTDIMGQRRTSTMYDSINDTLIPPAGEQDKNTKAIRNGDAVICDDSSQDLPEYPYSTVRVWLCSTIVIVIYVVVIVSLAPVTAQYLFYRFARNHHYNTTTNSTNSEKTCTNSTNGGDDFINKAQREASNTMLYATIASSLPAFLTCLFAGSLSDFLGRKFLLICSLSGGIIKTIILCLIIKLDLDIQLIYIGYVVDGVVGSMFTTVLAVTAIITDITRESEKRAVRFAVIEGIILVCAALSQLAVGYLIEAAGFFDPVLICVCLLFATLLIVIFLLPETLRIKENFTWNIVAHIKKTFRFYYASGIIKGRRSRFIIGLSTHLTVMFANLGKSNIETMFVLNWPICWSSVEIGIYGAIKTVVMSVAGVLLLTVCKNRLSLEVTGMICGVSSIAGYILEGFANSTLMMYLSALAGILFTAALPLPRALLSQIASSNEQGALFSSMSCMEAIATLVSTAIFTFIYNATLDIFRGAVFMVLAGICLLSIVFFGINRHLRLASHDSYESIISDPENSEKDCASPHGKSDSRKV